MRVLELGVYIVPAYAGMILAEQGHDVVKWMGSRPDPVLGLYRGAELWAWLNTGKRVITRHARRIVAVKPGEYDVVVDNIRASTWREWGIDPASEARRLGVSWASMRDDLEPDGRSFDAVAQARAWGDHLGYIPFYIGDTAGGLWLAFKALASPPGHHVVYQATSLAKLVEGELVVIEPRAGVDTPPWDRPGEYGCDVDGVRVRYRGAWVTEPFRDVSWRVRHLHHRGGRLTI
jgi:hypothetical protein